LKLKSEVVGEFVKAAAPANFGLAFGWGPAGAGLVAFSIQGRIVIMDDQGRKQEIRRRNPLFPAWTDDGKRRDLRDRQEQGRPRDRRPPSQRRDPNWLDCVGRAVDVDAGGADPARSVHHRRSSRSARRCCSSSDDRRPGILLVERGATRDDFDVLEDGTPQKIERVYTVSGPTVTASSVAAAAPAEAVATSPPVPATAPPRTFVLLLDQEHFKDPSYWSAFLLINSWL
jgi:hypothetical protein